MLESIINLVSSGAVDSHATHRKLPLLPCCVPQ